MKYFFLLAILLLGSCGSDQESSLLKDKREWKIQLEDDLGVVSIFLPEAYDTTIKVLLNNDTATINRERLVRVQSKQSPLLPISNFIWFDPKGFADHLSITYNKNNHVNTVIQLNERLVDSISNMAALNFCTVTWIDTLRSADKHLFVAYTFENDMNEDTKIIGLSAQTLLKGTQVHFTFFSKTKPESTDTNFTKKAIEYIKSIQITN